MPDYQKEIDKLIVKIKPLQERLVELQKVQKEEKLTEIIEAIEKQLLEIPVNLLNELPKRLNLSQILFTENIRTQEELIKLLNLNKASNALFANESDDSKILEESEDK